MMQIEFVQWLTDTWHNTYPRTVSTALSGPASVSAPPRGYD
jgi:hypothetical protein